MFSPRWSPDGRYIAALTPDYTKVMLFDFQTQKWTTWFTDAAGSVSYPQWSGDSKSIYFDDMTILKSLLMIGSERGLSGDLEDRDMPGRLGSSPTQ